MWISPGMKAWFKTRICIIILYHYGRWMETNYIIIPKDAFKHKVLSWQTWTIQIIPSFLIFQRLQAMLWHKSLKHAHFGEIRDYWTPFHKMHPFPFLASTRMHLYFRFNRQNFIKQYMWRHQPHKGAISIYGILHFIFY